MIAVGIDAGLAHCGVVALDGARKILACQVVLTARDKKRMGDTQARLAEVLDEVEAVLEALPGSPDVVVVEWPIVGGRGAGDAAGRSAKSSAQTFAVAGGLVGMLRRVTPVLLSPVPGTWRANVGNVDGGRLTTEELHAHLDTVHGVTALVGKTNAPHALDAVGLATYGLNHLVAQRHLAA